MGGFSCSGRFRMEVSHQVVRKSRAGAREPAPANLHFNFYSPHFFLVFLSFGFWCHFIGIIFLIQHFSMASTFYLSFSERDHRLTLQNIAQKLPPKLTTPSHSAAQLFFFARQEMVHLSSSTWSLKGREVRGEELKLKVR